MVSYCSYGLPMLSCGFRVVFLCVQMVFVWLSHAFAWFVSCGFRMISFVLLLFSHGFRKVFAWLSFGYRWLFVCFPYGFRLICVWLFEM